MGIVKGLNAAGALTKGALILLLIAALFAWIGFCCTGWGRTDNGFPNSDIFIGLWRMCTNSKTAPNCQQIDGWALGNISIK